jgi:uncharacterized protein DUF1566/carboxypeptidase family protein/Big-like domain-containing protein
VHAPFGGGFLIPRPLGEVDYFVDGTSFATTTDASGAWSISDVPAGNYGVRASKMGHEDATATDQDVKADQDTAVPTMTLAIETSSIGGTVTLSNTPDASGVDVVATASWDAGLTRSASTNSSGGYTIEDVLPGMWNVEASKSGYFTGSKENVFVQAATPTVGINFTLDEAPVGVAHDIQYVSGGSNNSDPLQTAVVYNALSAPFVVKIVDGFGDPVANAHVNYTLVDPKTDGNMLTSGMITTGADGLATNTYVVGKKVGTNQVRIECLEILNDEVDFYADGTPDIPDELVPMGGSLQDGVVGQQLTDPLIVEVRDQYDNVVTGQTVSFTPSGDGTATPNSVVSGSDGRAQTQWTLATTMGTQTLDVACGLATHPFTADADHDDAHEIVITDGNNQNGINTTTLATDLEVRVQDQHGNPVDGESVSFAVTTGSGDLDPSTPQTTVADGLADVSLTLQSLGDIEVTASVSGLSSVVFQATSLTSEPHHFVVVSGEGQSGVVGQQLTNPIVVRLEDSFDNPLEGVWVNFSAGASGGTAGSAGTPTVQTSASGEAQSMFTLGTLAGTTTQWLDVEEPNYTITTLITADGEPDVPAGISIVSGNDQTAAYGQQLAVNLVVDVEDQYSNPVWDYPVTWSSTTGSTGDTSTITGTNGQTSTTGTLGSTPGVPDQYFTATAGTVDVTFDATATGHYIDRIESWRVWPGYPDTVTIIGAGFDDANALVVWNVGGTEQVVAHESRTNTEIVFYPPTADVAVIGDYPVTVRNPGPTDCAPVTFEVGYLIPDTGQTQCYNATGTEVACSTITVGDPLYGQDGHDEVASRQHHYTDNSDGTVTDDVTGLMWQQTSSAPWMNWYEATGTAHATDNPGGATDYCGDLPDGGYDDWRLPTLHELVTLADLSKTNPSIDQTAFPAIPGGSFWSSSSYASNSNYAWYVDFYGGSSYYHDKTSPSYARCVRSGPLNLGSFDSLILSGDRVVCDTDTGFIWQGCAGGQSGDTCETGSASMMNWQTALGYCEELSWGGHNDWRLPDLAELQSIVDCDTYSPAIDPIAFPVAPLGYFWSSSSYAADVSDAWVVYFNYGGSYGRGEPYTSYARCVRSGQ